MTRLLAIVVAVVGLALTGQAVAGVDGAWIPGSNYMVEEMDASDLLEKTYDSAYCDGIARFGKRGSFPYEEYLVFDCDIFHDDWSCENRYKSIKGTKRGWFKLRLLREDCY